ncbi:MAG: glycosyltransferase [Lachnospiraceae bacterium]|nr:glycosyltransferase [Lachnospiraceae bacterium]
MEKMKLNENFKFKRIYVIFLSLFTLIYLTWRIGWTLPYEHGIADMVFAVILLVTELLGAMEMAVHFALEKGRKPCPQPPSWTANDLPEVDVFVPTCGEPVSLVKNTLQGCLSMDYPEKKVHIYLCDDAGRDEMKLLSNELGVRYLARKTREDAKAGNLNNALKVSSSPLVVIFDADMRPEPEFLVKTVPYFLGNKDKSKQGARRLDNKIGFVQTPQDFRDYDLFQRAFHTEDIIPNEQDYFYHELEPARNEINAVIFGGSNTVLSRRALLDVGGFATGTITEDFATGIEIQKKGYKCVAIDTPLASGLCPESLTGMIKQRTRWARGCIQAGRTTHLLFGKGLTFAQRCSYIAAITYWYAPIKRLIYLMSPLMFSVFGITVMKCEFKHMLLFWLPMYLMAVFGIRILSGGIRTARWSEIYELCLFPFLLPGVVAETLGFKKKEFVVTDKSGKDDWKFRYVLPYVVLIGLSGIGIANTLGRMINEHTNIYLFLLFWLCFNLYELMYAFVFVVSCRKLPKAQERKNRLRCFTGNGVKQASLLYIFYKKLKNESKEEKIA